MPKASFAATTAGSVAHTMVAASAVNIRDAVAVQEVDGAGRIMVDVAAATTGASSAVIMARTAVAIMKAVGIRRRVVHALRHDPVSDSAVQGLRAC
jgi:hypothetical protein